MVDDTLSRLKSVDWRRQSEATICSQLILPVLILLGYGEHTLQTQSYPLRDPYVSKRSRRVGGAASGLGLMRHCKT
jgi:hypothetical protein